MTNHVHLLATPKNAGGVSRMLQHLGRRYVPFVNARHRRTGSLWEGRFRACLVDSGDYVLACQRYIELNPVRAAMCLEPLAYTWSSYRANAEGHADGLLTPHEDYRRMRAAALNMIITTTGAARALKEVIPEMEGKLDGMAIRVPTPNVSCVDLVATMQKPVTREAVNDAYRKAAAGPLKGILAASDEELVSSDFNGNKHSSIFDAPITKVLEPGFAKILSWYDNEMGFSARMGDVIAMMAKSL
jgi:hypothetical protein